MKWFKKKIPNRRYTWVPDVPDHRDKLYSLTYQAPKVLPPIVDLRKICPPVQDQKTLGSCSACALTGAVEILEGIDKLPEVMMSRLFVYYNERNIEHTVRQDSGAQLRDGIKTLASQGCCQESLWPYIINRFETKPSNAAYMDGLNHKITSYQRLNTLADMKACLASGFPFVFGFSVYESFESEAVAKTGIVPMPLQNERCLGGHAICCVGFNDPRSVMVVRNSWGIGWGIRGYFLLPMAYISNPDLACDFWTIRRGTGM